jgi:hypothetical protein
MQRCGGCLEGMDDCDGVHSSLQSYAACLDLLEVLLCFALGLFALHSHKLLVRVVLQAHAPVGCVSIVCVTDSSSRRGRGAVCAWFGLGSRLRVYSASPRALHACIHVGRDHCLWIHKNTCILQCLWNLK